MKQRTLRQNAAIHLWFEKLSEYMNDAGYSVTKTLRHDADIPWTPVLIKELMFKSVMRAMYEKTSTADLSSGELQLVWDTLNRHLGERFGIHVPFPSLEALIDEHDRMLKANYPQEDCDPKF